MVSQAKIKSRIRGEAKKAASYVTQIRVSFRWTKAEDALSCDAREWMTDADLHDNVLLSECRVPQDGVLDLWLYEGRGDSLNLVENATVVLVAGQVTTFSKRDYSLFV